MKHFIASFVLFTSVATLAQKPGIDFTKPIKTLGGDAITAPGSDGKPEPLTLGDVVVNAVQTPTQADQALSGEEKFKLFLLAERVYKAKAAVLSPAETKLVCDRVGRMYSPMVVGAVWQALDCPVAK